mmetsp:Transcript_47672/g.116810  ORF Transcript_47672/g.116810 Transcript_47672/m.116810 type:complete len:158 (-) Transcript_47672:56-529(-)
MAKEELQGCHISVKLKQSDFTVRNRSRVLREAIFSQNDLFREAWALIEKELPIELRLLGVRMSGFGFEDAGLLTNWSSIAGLFAAVENEEQPTHADHTSTGTTFTCPVCKSFQGDEGRIDQHIDICLSVHSGHLAKGSKSAPKARKKRATIEQFFGT